MEEMRKNVVAAQQKSFEAEQSPCNALREYVEGYDRDQGRGQDPDDKMLAINAEPRHKEYEPRKDMEDIQSTARRVGWCEEEKTTMLWKQMEGDEQKAPQP